LTGKYFPLTNFLNGKQTQESLESGFPESEFRETNMTLVMIQYESLEGNGARFLTKRDNMKKNIDH
jgi:hypothetical protein